MLNNRPILKKALQIALTIALGALGGGGLMFVSPPAPAPDAKATFTVEVGPKPPAMAVAPDGALECGWTPNPAAVKKVLESHPKGGTLKGVAPHLFPKRGVEGEAETSKKDALLYKYLAQVNGGQNPPAHNQQQVGCCVSEGGSYSVELLEAVEIIKKRDSEVYKTVSHSAIYGLARARRHMLGNRDGLVGAYAAESVCKDGVVSCEDAGETNQTSGFAKAWGRTGVPPKIKELASQRVVKDYALVKNEEEVYTALSNGYPVSICSDVGFTMTRDARGACRPQATWNHCMACAGYRSDTDQYLIVQSWGENVPSGPTSLDQPNYSFWIESKVLNHMVSQGDSFAFSNFDGWPTQELDWFARRNDAIRDWRNAVASLSLR